VTAVTARNPPVTAAETAPLVHASRIPRQGALALPRRLVLAVLIATVGLACAGRAAGAPAPHWSSGFETGDLGDWLISGEVTQPPPAVDAVHVRSGRDAAAGPV